MIDVMIIIHYSLIFYFLIYHHIAALVSNIFMIQKFIQQQYQ